MSIQQHNYTFSLPVFNVPNYANQKPYWVVNKIDNEFWFFGAYETAHKAIGLSGIMYPSFRLYSFIASSCFTLTPRTLVNIHNADNLFT